jgi:enoyl-CoA hydratase/carnithine racemase
MGDTLNGEEARECGLVSHVVDDGLAVDEALAQADALAAKPREALRATKLLIKAPWREAVSEALERERSVFADRLRSEDCRAALARMGKG